MLLISLLSVLISVQSSLSFELNLTTQFPPPNSNVGIHWTRNDTDPPDFTLVVLQVLEGQNASSNITKHIDAGNDGQQGQGEGEAEMPVGPSGEYRITAVHFDSPNDTSVLATLDFQVVVQDPEGTSSTSTTSNATSATSTPTSAGQTEPPSSTSTSTSQPSSNKRAIIIGSVLGGIAFLTIILAVAVFLFRKRQRQIKQRPITFHRDMMVRSSGQTLYGFSNGAASGGADTSLILERGERDSKEHLST